MLNGLDVSHYNGTFNWDKPKADGISFSYIKATEGANYVDPQFARNWNVAYSKIPYVGAYHFFHPAQDALAQASFFLKVIGSKIPGELPPALDMETLDGISGRFEVSGALKWLNAVGTALGKSPVVYMSPGFAEGLDLEAFKQYPLWIAEYGVSRPRAISPFPTWTFWQTSDSNGLDVDLFNGDIEQLRALTL